MTDVQEPSIDPANEGDLTGAFRHIISKMLETVDDMLPAKIIAYDRLKNRASVQPLVRVITTSNPTIGIARAQIMSVPVLQIGGGGFVLNFNLKAGDLGWIKANDRDISIFLQGYSDSVPNTLRKHNFADAVFIPDVMRGWTIAGEDAENAVLQSLDGNTKISLGAEQMKLKVGATEMVLTNDGIDITAGHVKHGGITIGNNHIHSQGADSDGDSEQDTGVPHE